MQPLCSGPTCGVPGAGHPLPHAAEAGAGSTQGHHRQDRRLRAYRELLLGYPDFLFMVSGWILGHCELLLGMDRINFFFNPAKCTVTSPIFGNRLDSLYTAGVSFRYPISGRLSNSVPGRMFGLSNI